MITNTDRAAELGAQHGREAGETWYDAFLGREGRGADEQRRTVARWINDSSGAEFLGLPEPDLSGGAPLALFGQTGSPIGLPIPAHLRGAYCDAFRAAVEETIRAKVTP